MTNYFDFYELEPAFIIDESALKKTFYQNSKAYHPDFYTLESDEKQSEILALSTLNNKAYKVLGDFHKRMHHLLDLNGCIAEEGKAKLPQAFLMEMMDVNEAIMELQFDPHAEGKEKVMEDIKAAQQEAFNLIQPLLESYNHSDPDQKALSQIADYYYKHKYLLRLEENLDKIG